MCFNMGGPIRLSVCRACAACGGPASSEGERRGHESDRQQAVHCSPPQVPCPAKLGAVKPTLVPV